MISFQVWIALTTRLRPRTAYRGGSLKVGGQSVTSFSRIYEQSSGVFVKFDGRVAGSSRICIEIKFDGRVTGVGAILR